MQHEAAPAALLLQRQHLVECELTHAISATAPARRLASVHTCRLEVVARLNRICLILQRQGKFYANPLPNR
ncbi:MAG: hypothetical protein ACUVR8_03235 [Acidobacteriota bacterium]